jgi:hypothetical protein
VERESLILRGCHSREILSYGVTGKFSKIPPLKIRKISPLKVRGERGVMNQKDLSFRREAER